MPIRSHSVKTLAVATIACATLAGCGRDFPPYKPRSSEKPVQVSMPAIPNVAQRPIKNGDAYTVWGASYYLRNRVHKAEVAGKKLDIIGWIIKTNMEDAPECAVHKGGQADPEGCKAPIPAFWIADSKEASLDDSIKVMGWASNFAQIFDAITAYDSAKDSEHMDTFWGITLPKPLPAKGAKVRVTGTYGTTFTGASTGAEADPFQGLMHWQKHELLEPAPELSTLPGVKRKPPKDAPMSAE
jgi:hypothetical protein